MHRTRYLAGLLVLVLTAFGLVFLFDALGGNEGGGGMVLRVEFRDARGLRSGGDVRYRGVTVGTVRAVQISEDGGKALVDLVLDQSGAAQACVASAFWVVSPRFSGLAGGASGLDTLVRDAYVAFVTPEDHGSHLRDGSLVVGMERPPASLEPETLEPVAHGDLLMTMLVPENHGLRPGSTVVHRGITTGDVRSVGLAEDGSHVEVVMRIHRQHRHTITDKSVFWIARPYISGALFSGFTVADVSALLSPYVAYHSVPGSGTPVEDGFRTAAESMRPDLRIDDVPQSALARRPPKERPPEDPLVLVRIVYAALEEDWLSADDHIRRTGSGLLYLDKSGRVVVLTARSLVDAGFTERDTFGGSPDITQEQIKVMMPGGSVLRSGRVWVDPTGLDLAVLILEGTAPDQRGTPAAMIDFNTQSTALADTLRSAGEDGKPTAPHKIAGSPPDLAGGRGSAAMRGDQVVGIQGQRGGRDEVPTIHPLGSVPDDLRPGG